MKAVLMTEFNGPLPVEDVPDPECPADGVIVDIRACGVCRSDHHAWKGADPDVTLPHVMGHELAGEVLEIGPECRGFKVGDRVTAPFVLGCGACPDCRGGEPTVCDHQHVIGFSGWGAFAERIAVSRGDFNLVHLPDSLDFVSAAGMGCRVTTAFRAVLDRGELRPGEWLAVQGCGGIGLSSIMIGAAIGGRVIGIDVTPEALDMAKKLGAHHLIDATSVPDVGEAVRDLTGGGAHVSIDALGITETFHNSLKSLRKMGKHVQVGMPVGSHSNPPLPLLDLVYARQLTLHGTRGLGAHRFEALFDLVEAGGFDPSRLVSKTIALSGVHSVLRDMDSFHGAGVTVIDRLHA